MVCVRYQVLEIFVKSMDAKEKEKKGNANFQGKNTDADLLNGTVILS